MTTSLIGSNVTTTKSAKEGLGKASGEPHAFIITIFPLKGTALAVPYSL
jgi:hypothetical protein